MKWYAKFFHLPCSHWVWFHKTFLSTPKKQSPKIIISATNNKINIVSSKNAITAQVIHFVLHVVYNETKREKSPGESRYAILFVTKWKKKKFAETKLFLLDEQSLHMKMLRANFVSCCGANCVNQYFQILSLVDYGRKVPEGKLEPIGLKDHLFHLLKTLNRNIIIWTHCQTLVRAQTDKDTSSDKNEDKNEGYVWRYICLSHSNNAEEPYWALWQ